jgi:hypothetical protein
MLYLRARSLYHQPQLLVKLKVKRENLSYTFLNTTIDRLSFNVVYDSKFVITQFGALFMCWLQIRN